MFDAVIYILCLKMFYIDSICVVLKEEFFYKNDM